MIFCFKPLKTSIIKKPDDLRKFNKPEELSMLYINYLFLEKCDNSAFLLNF